MELRVLKLMRTKELDLISEERNFSICSFVIKKIFANVRFYQLQKGIKFTVTNALFIYRVIY